MMAKEIEILKERIQDLEEELTFKNAEVLRYRQELFKVNQSLEKLTQQISQEIRISTILQKILSPTELPKMKGFEFSTKYVPGTKFGGDYFDIFEHDNKLKFGIIMASASGYTMSALLLSVIIKISSRMESRRALDPSQVLHNLATEVMPYIQNSDYASIFYAVVDRSTMQMTYSQAGQISSFIQQGGRSALRALNSTNAIQLNTQIEPVDETIDLAAHDRLILCSEGIVKAPTVNGDNVGTQGLLRLLQDTQRLSVHELRNEVLYQLEKLSGLQEPLRDQTLIVMEAKENVSKLIKV